jgi:hypothetical protein
MPGGVERIEALKTAGQRPPVTLHGVVFDILAGNDILVGNDNGVGLCGREAGLPSRRSRAAPAFAQWALAWQPSLRNGLPSRTDSILAEGVGFIHSLENIGKFSAEWQTSDRIVSLNCLKICRRWQTGQGRIEFDSPSILPSHDATW